jgi:hypothetical protein
MNVSDFGSASRKIPAFIVSLLIVVPLMSSCGEAVSPEGTQLRDGTILLNWTAPTQRTDNSDLPSNEIFGYMVYYGRSPGQYKQSVFVASGTSCTISNLISNRYYYFAIKVVDIYGNVSEPTDEISTLILPPPEPPEDLSTYTSGPQG